MTVLSRVSQGTCKAKFLSFSFRSDVLFSENNFLFCFVFENQVATLVGYETELNSKTWLR